MASQRERVTGTEQYYTPIEISTYCVEKMLDVVKNKNVTWLEPAGGKGAFIEALLIKGIKNIVSFDIEPLHKMVQLTDNFLTENLSNLNLERSITLTNPPFGRANSLAIPFFNKCAEVSDCIGFIVPKSWRKWSVINKLNTSFHCIYDEELQVNYDYPNANVKSKNKLATVFQIWERQSLEREIIKIEDRGYIKKVKPEEADVSLTVFGRGCGKIKTDFPRIPNTTQMFLKIENSEVLAALQSVDFSRFFNNVAFVEALSIMEINYLLNEYFDGQK
jgi:predicted RNA methylase